MSLPPVGARVTVWSLHVTREDVEKGNIAPALSELARLLDPTNVQCLQQKMVVEVVGYGDVALALYEIDEVRKWVKLLDAAFPFWIYFMWPGYGTSLRWMAHCLCEYAESQDGETLDQEWLRTFVQSHLDAMVGLYSAAGISQTDILAVTLDIAACLGLERDCPQSEVPVGDGECAIPPGGAQARLTTFSQGDTNLDLPLARMLVEAQIGPGISATFLLDTGDPVSFLYEGAVRRLGLALAASRASWSKRILGIHSESPVVGMVDIPLLSLGGLSGGTHVLEVHRDPSSADLRTEYGVVTHNADGDGTLGADILASFDWCIDKRGNCLHVFPPGYFSAKLLRSFGFVVDELRIAEDGTPLVSIAALGRTWSVTLDTAGGILLYEDAIAAAGLSGAISNMKEGRGTFGSTAYMAVPELRVAGVEFGNRIVSVHRRVTPHEDGIAGGTLFDNAVVSVSATNGIVGIARIAAEYSQEDFNVLAPARWEAGQSSYNEHRWSAAAAAFLGYADMFEAVGGQGAQRNRLAGRLMQASALMNDNQDDLARQILTEIRSTDEAFEPEKVSRLMASLR